MTHLGSVLEIYDFIEQIGDGSFGTVHKAKHKISQKIVAVKVMKKKYKTIDDCKDQFEPKLLHLLPPHLNIVQMYDSCFSVQGDLSFIMEFMDGGNLYQLMRERRQQHLPLSNCELRNILFQILSAVSHVHHHNVFHRDMKPENLLIDYNHGKPIIKLADFGLARELNSEPPYTEYVSTRWYRAPEVLLRSTEYTSSVDLWAVGAIFAELITLEPLFPGESEIDQIYRICDILGSPGNNRFVLANKKKIVRAEKRASPGFARKKMIEKESDQHHSVHSTLSALDGGGEWKEGVRLAYKIGFKFPNCIPKPLETVVRGASDSMLDLLRHFLLFNPSYRWSADTALKHAFFSEEEEPVHRVIPLDIGPITPPDKHESIPISRGLYSSQSIITPFDLLPIPTSPHQICPDWGADSPSSSRSGSITTHLDRFLHDIEPPSSPTNHPHHHHPWLTSSRPIYSSHEKVHPITDTPLHYRYASHQKQRLDTPTKENKKEYHNTVVNTLSVSNKTSFHLEHIPHYGHHQLIKWTPSPIHHPEELSKRPIRCRSPAIFSVKSNQDIRLHKQQQPKSRRFNLWLPSEDDPKEEDNNAFRFLPLQ